ncbi:inositol monophosphatase [Candidatus Poribacteria bacterium]|nr:inositol monophosphatase [Candidatus Poribacteria bacterium]
MDLIQYANTAERVARRAGEGLLRHFERIETIEYKGIGDIVTEADRASEVLIREELTKAHPDIPVYGEEYGFAESAADRSDGLCWIVDPLDGTANYAARLGLFGVSIGLLHHGSPVVGVIHDPIRGDMFRGTRGGGAFRNGRPCRVSDIDPFDPIAPVAVSGDVMRQRLVLLSETYKGRSLGAASLHLAYIADGILAAALDPYTKLWDVTAGAVLIEEAGGTVTRWDGSPRFPVGASDDAFQGAPFEYLVSNGVRHERLVELLSLGGIPA